MAALPSSENICYFRGGCSLGSASLPPPHKAATTLGASAGQIAHFEYPCASESGLVFPEKLVNRLWIKKQSENGLYFVIFVAFKK
jgi:hypothetical protein